MIIKSNRIFFKLTTYYYQYEIKCNNLLAYKAYYVAMQIITFSFYKVIASIFKTHNNF